MREKRLMAFRMAPKRSSPQVKKVETLAAGWKKCKLSEAGICALVEDRLLQSRTIIGWRSGKGEDRPYEGTNEIVLFRSFIERGLAVPSSDFFRGLLRFGKSNCIIYPPIPFCILPSSPIFAKPF